MSGISDYGKNKVLDDLVSGGAFLALFTTAPTDAGGGTEVLGAGYARQSVTFSAASGGSKSNTSTHTFTASGGNFGDVVAGALYDAASGGNLLYWDAFTSATTNDGESITVNPGGFVVTASSAT